MKRMLFFLMLSLFSIVFGIGQNEAFAQVQCAFPSGSKAVNVGFGLGSSTLDYDFVVPSGNVSFEYAFKDVMDDRASISAGGYFGFGAGKSKESEGSISNLSWGNNGLNAEREKVKESRFRIGVRGTFHYSFVENLDTYAGVDFGFQHSKYKNTIVESFNRFFVPQVFVGARYMFSNVGVFAESSIQRFAFVQLGVSFKF